ncbi:MAG TPA: hypothetical protein VL361_20300 [Candidatus Limnocylindrales bacterium]|jgi:hypothetical protein|nr:hypothetical protein [Candidatus Limnocylindrales bacterium]
MRYARQKFNAFCSQGRPREMYPQSSELSADRFAAILTSQLTFLLLHLSLLAARMTGPPFCL